jgi:hypothetical protein
MTMLRTALELAATAGAAYLGYRSTQIATNGNKTAAAISGTVTGGMAALYFFAPGGMAAVNAGTMAAIGAAGVGVAAIDAYHAVRVNDMKGTDFAAWLSAQATKGRELVSDAVSSVVS